MAKPKSLLPKKKKDTSVWGAAKKVAAGSKELKKGATASAIRDAKKIAGKAHKKVIAKKVSLRNRKAAVESFKKNLSAQRKAAKKK